MLVEFLLLKIRNFQIDNTWVCFLDKNWPSLHFWDLTKCILKYQRMFAKKLLAKMDLRG